MIFDFFFPFLSYLIFPHWLCLLCGKKLAEFFFLCTLPKGKNSLRNNSFWGFILFFFRNEVVLQPLNWNILFWDKWSITDCWYKIFRDNQGIPAFFYFSVFFFLFFSWALGRLNMVEIWFLTLLMHHGLKSSAFVWIQNFGQKWKWNLSSLICYYMNKTDVVTWQHNSLARESNLIKLSGIGIGVIKSNLISSVIYLTKLIDHKQADAI